MCAICFIFSFLNLSLSSSGTINSFYDSHVLLASTHLADSLVASQHCHYVIWSFISSSDFGVTQSHI